MIPRYALAAAGLLDEPRITQIGARIERLISYFERRPDKPLTTDELARQSGLSRQACEAALHTLAALSKVRRTTEPPPRGTGRPRNVWRWISAGK
jgi:predicted ArsR family transcriptional regulator